MSIENGGGSNNTRPPEGTPRRGGLPVGETTLAERQASRERVGQELGGLPVDSGKIPVTQPGQNPQRTVGVERSGVDRSGLGESILPAGSLGVSRELPPLNLADIVLNEIPERSELAQDMAQYLLVSRIIGSLQASTLAEVPVTFRGGRAQLRRLREILTQTGINQIDPRVEGDQDELVVKMKLSLPQANQPSHRSSGQQEAGLSSNQINEAPDPNTPRPILPDDLGEVVDGPVTPGQTAAGRTQIFDGEEEMGTTPASGQVRSEAEATPSDIEDTAARGKRLFANLPPRRPSPPDSAVVNGKAAPHEPQPVAGQAPPPSEPEPRLPTVLPAGTPPETPSRENSVQEEIDRLRNEVEEKIQAISSGGPWAGPIMEMVLHVSRIIELAPNDLIDEREEVWSEQIRTAFTNLDNETANLQRVGTTRAFMRFFRDLMPLLTSENQSEVGLSTDLVSRVIIATRNLGLNQTLNLGEPLARIQNLLQPGITLEARKVGIENLIKEVAPELFEEPTDQPVIDNSRPPKQYGKWDPRGWRFNRKPRQEPIVIRQMPPKETAPKAPPARQVEVSGSEGVRVTAEQLAQVVDFDPNDINVSNAQKILLAAGGAIVGNLPDSDIERARATLDEKLKAARNEGNFAPAASFSRALSNELRDLGSLGEEEMRKHLGLLLKTVEKLSLADYIPGLKDEVERLKPYLEE